MKIIIIGCGKVGVTIAQHLSAENNDVIMIDKDQEPLSRIEDLYDIMSMKGNGLRTSVLTEAGAGEADLVICVTASDEINMLCCLTAKRLGAKHVIARIRDPEYAEEVSKLKKEIGIDMAINPEQQAAAEIFRILRFPSANQVDTFVNGKAEMVSFRVDEKNPHIGKKVHHIFGKNKPVLFATFERDGEVIIPNGETTLENGDMVRVIGKPIGVSAFFRSIGKSSSKVKDALIIGGGKITIYLALLLENVDIKTKIMEIQRKKCEELSELLPASTILHGDGSDMDSLNREGMGDVDSIVCLTDFDEENIMIALYAMSKKVNKVIAKVNRVEYDGLVRNLGIDSIISPKKITAYQIIRYVRGLHNSLEKSQIQTLYKIGEGENAAEALELIATKNDRCIKIALKDLTLKPEILVACIVRQNKIIIPSGFDEMYPGDSIIVITKNKEITSLDDILLHGGV